MYLTQFVKADPMKAAIVPIILRPGKNNHKSPNRGYPSRLGKRMYELAAKGVLINADGKMTTVYCDEHDRHELVYSLNYDYDLSGWYAAGIHPKFSIAAALLEAEQNLRELNLFLGWRVRREITEALKVSKTQEQFLEAMKPHLFTTLKVGRRRIRVPQRTKEKFEAKSFTVRDFLREQNQEVRRLIARIVPVKEVLGHMKKVAQDEEGTLYDYRHNGQQWDSRNRRYLHVTCPSTAQEYLLEVPDRFEKPKEARRWTFRLDAEAEFAKEA